MGTLKCEMGSKMKTFGELNGVYYDIYVGVPKFP